MKNIFQSWITALTGNPSSKQPASVPRCFHCDEPIIELTELEFAGARRALCCHGCKAVLQAIEQAGAGEVYLQNKAQAASDAMRGRQ